MGEIKVIREDDMPEFEINEVKVKREARRKAAVEKEKGVHHVELRKPQGEVKLFSMNTGMTRYWGVHVDVSSITLRDVLMACTKAQLGNIPDVELIVLEFKDKTLVFDPMDGRVIR